MRLESKVVEIYTDGACRGNPGPGGWGALLRYRGRERHLQGAAAATTNNRMELTAAIEALRALTRPSRVHLHTDSQYVKNGITAWMVGWKKRGWKTAARAPVKNVDLWQQLDEACTAHQVSWYWVKGHSGHADNDKADSLANAAIDEMLG